MRYLHLLLLVIAFSPCSAVAEPETEPAATSIAKLQQQLEKVLTDTRTPGASVAIVRRDGPQWVTGLGLADVAAGRPATAATLFRIGSASKAFASLAVLKLAAAGQLSLDDPVRKLAPEVWFENAWEATDPVRVVNLLEHTTGWDDAHFRELAKDAPAIGLREALDFDHHSRISRWRPGTRMAYCNSGAAVAALIVEKITGERFEDYVAQNFFGPIGMQTASYFQPPASLTATLYHDDGKSPYAYWNILFRPSGAINASADDMARYLLFYLNRGSVDGRQVLPAAALDRMETPVSTWAARQGLKDGYGLGNYWSIHDGFVYHGHNGGMQGGLTEMAYLPDAGVGYFYSINSGSSEAYRKFNNLIRAYITREQSRPALPPRAPLPDAAAAYAGWYEFDSSRVQMLHFLEKLLTLTRIQFRDGKLVASYLGSSGDVYVPVTGLLFRHVATDAPPDPVAIVALLEPNQDGRFIQLGIGTTFRQVPAWVGVLQLVLTAYALLAIISILIYAPFWLLGGLSLRRRRPAERAMRLWPLTAVLSLLGIVVTMALCGEEAISRLGNLTGYSAALWGFTVLYAVAAVAGAAACWRARRTVIRRGVRIYSLLVCAALLIGAAYLAWWGVIGLRTWA
ncbi:MAG TPA: serine hydrolase domain-containing protein [Steroidobacteraceae bacterium]